MLKYLEKHRTIALIMTLLLAAEIFYISSISSFPGPPIKGINFSVIYHITVFFLFSFFLLITLKGESKFRAKHLIWTIVISFLYAISDEIHQLFVPGRFSTMNDVLIDSFGMLLAILIYPKRTQSKDKKTNKKKLSKK
jgi:VanZ family protein